MATKTFNIGEVCYGGRLKVQVAGKLVLVECLDWKTKKPLGGQYSGSCMATDPRAETKVLDFLNNMTTSYYADKILAYIKSLVTLNSAPW